jgi:hypothetical protein
VFPPYETVMRRGEGVPIEHFFPVLRHSPNIPPIVPPRESIAQGTDRPRTIKGRR